MCPSHIPLVQYFSHAKGELTAAEHTRLRTDATKRLAEAKAARIERENQEKQEAAARRKAEREAAKAAAAAGSASPAGEKTQGASA